MKNDPLINALQNQEVTSTVTDIPEDNSFSYDGFQVVRGEFFSHIYEPSITFSDYKVYVNTTCIRKLPEYDYVQILVNPENLKLAVRPCMEEEKDSFRWCSASAKRTPKTITCRLFFAKVMELMNWNPMHRYKMLGKLIRSNNELLFVFDLKAPEIYQRTIKENGKPKSSRIPIFPEEWKNQFGVPVAEHKNQLRIDIFDNYAVFGLEKEKSKKSMEQTSTPSANT